MSLHVLLLKHIIFIAYLLHISFIIYILFISYITFLLHILYILLVVDIAYITHVVNIVCYICEKSKCIKVANVDPKFNIESSYSFTNKYNYLLPKLNNY